MYLDRSHNAPATVARPVREAKLLRRSRKVFENSSIDYHVLFRGVHVVHRGKRTRVPVFNGMTAIVPKGRRIAIMGPKRSGKTTLVKLIAGVEVPRAGLVRRNSRISWPVGGAYFVSKALSVRDNVIFCAHLLGVPARQMLEYVDFLCGFGSKMEESVGNLPRHFTVRLNIALPLVVDFDCYLIDDQLPLARARFTSDREDFIISEIMSKDLIVTTSKKKFAMEFCDTGALIQDGHLEYCLSLQDALDAVDDGDPSEDFEEVDGDTQEDEDHLNGWW